METTRFSAIIKKIRDFCAGSIVGATVGFVVLTAGLTGAVVYQLKMKQDKITSIKQRIYEENMRKMELRLKEYNEGRERAEKEAEKKVVVPPVPLVKPSKPNLPEKVEKVPGPEAHNDYNIMTTTEQDIIRKAVEAAKLAAKKVVKDTVGSVVPPLPIPKPCNCTRIK